MLAKGEFDALSTWLRAALKHALTYRGLAAAVMNSALDHGNGLVSTWHAEMFEVGATLLARARQSGVVAAVADEADVLKMVGAIAWAAQDTPESSAQADRLLTLLMNGLPADQRMVAGRSMPLRDTGDLLDRVGRARPSAQQIADDLPERGRLGVRAQHPDLGPRPVQHPGAKGTTLGVVGVEQPFRCPPGDCYAGSPDLPHTIRHAAELTAGEGHDRFDFTLTLMIDGLAHR